MEEKLVYIKKILSDKNVRFTEQRETIIRFFLENNGHYKPEDVYNNIKSKDIGIATVYRVIDLLKSNEIIDEISIEKDRFYELKIFSKKILHSHLICEKCREIYDFDDKETTSQLLNTISVSEKNHNIKVNNISIVMTGVCSNCNALF